MFFLDGNRDLENPTDRRRSGLFRGFILRNSDIGVRHRKSSGGCTRAGGREFRSAALTMSVTREVLPANARSSNQDGRGARLLAVAFSAC